MDARQPPPRSKWKKKEKEQKVVQAFFFFFFRKRMLLAGGVSRFISISNKILGSKPSNERVIFQETRKSDAKGSVVTLLSVFILYSRQGPAGNMP